MRDPSGSESATARIFASIVVFVARVEPSFDVTGSSAANAIVVDETGARQIKIVLSDHF